MIRRETPGRRHAHVKPASLGSSAFWRLTETVGNELVSFLAFVFLARMLTPHDFGAVALAGSIMVLLQAVLYHGCTDALVQLPSCEPRHARAALAANFRLASALVAAGAAIAWPLALLLERPEFAHLLWALLPSLWLRSLCAPMLAALRRGMDFRSIALRTLLGVLVGGLAALTLGHLGAGAWALVAQQWTSEVVGFAVLAIASPLKPWSGCWNRSALDELLPVALPVTGAQLSNQAARRLDTLAVEWHLGHQAVGIYFLVARLVFAVQMVTQHGLGDVALVVLSRASGRPQVRNALVLQVLRLSALACTVAFGLLALLAGELVPLLFGPSWQEAAAPLAALAALAPAGSMVALVGVALVAAGDARSFQRLSIGLAVVQLAVIMVSAAWGLWAVAVAIGAAQCAALPVALHVLHRSLGVSRRRLLQAIGGPLLLYGGAAMAAISVAAPGGAWSSNWLAAALFVLLMGAGGVWLGRTPWRDVARLVRHDAPPGGRATTSHGLA